MSYTYVIGDARARLREMASQSVQCCVTSPPYYGLRDYGTATWEGGDPTCNHRQETAHQKQGASSARAGRSNVEEQRNENFRDVCGKCGAHRIDRQIGLESTPDAYVAQLVAVFREVRRVLRDDGTLWLNLGDSYANGGRKTRDPGKSKIHPAFVGDAYRDGLRPSDPSGGKPKDLLGIPWRVAFALQADGWYLRSDIIWSKPNPMPESVTDRPTKAHEYLFLLAKSERYYYDAAAVGEPIQTDPRENYPARARVIGRGGRDSLEQCGAPQQRSTGGFPPRAGKNEQSGDRRKAGFNDRWDARKSSAPTRNRRTVWTIPTQPYPGAHFATFPVKLIEPCILAGSHPNDLILDPFAGAGTVQLVAYQLGRRSHSIDLNPNYQILADARLANAIPIDWP